MTSAGFEPTAKLINKPLPLWSKVLIALVGSAVVLVIAAAIAGAVFFQHLYKVSQDPVSISRCVEQLAKFNSPLPADYKYILGYSCFGAQFVGVEHQGDRQPLFIVNFPNDSKEDAQSMVDRVFQGNQATGAPPLMQEQASKGELMVGGEKMPYAIGAIVDSEGKAAEAFIGWITPKNQRRSILLYGIQPANKKYDFAEAEKYLKTIQSF